MKILLPLFLLLAQYIYGQSLDLKDINLKDNFFLSKLPNGNSRFIYRVSRKDPREVTYRKIDLDSRFQVVDTSLIKFYGDHRMAATASSQRFTVALIYLSTSTSRDMMIHVLDEETREQKTFFIKMMGKWVKREVMLYPTSNPREFVFFYQGKKNTWEITRFDIDGNHLWRRIIHEETSDLIIHDIEFLRNDEMAMLVSSDVYKAKASHKVRLLDLKTGKDNREVNLAAPASSATVDNIFAVDSTYYVAGRRFFSNRSSNEKSGFQFLKKINHEINDLKYGVDASEGKIFWMDMVTDPTGRAYLLGETFTAEPYGAYLLKSLVTTVLTFGLASVAWTSMKFKDVVVVPIDSTTVIPPSFVRLNPIRTEKTGYMPAYLLAKYATRIGNRHYVGCDSSGNMYFVNNQNVYRRQLTSGTESTVASLQQGLAVASASVNEYGVRVFSVNKVKKTANFSFFPFQ